MNRTPALEAPQASLRHLLDSLRAYVEYQQSTGVDGFPYREASPATPAIALTAPPAAAGLAKPPARAGVAPAADLFVTPAVRTAKTLEGLRAELGDCRRCKLSPGRTQIVFGVGNPHATLMFVGEGPGRDEDLQGEPFVGRAGQLLT